MNTSSQIFVETDGSPIPVFVDAGLQRRPALVRSLAKSGAVIKFNANEARFILTDPTSDSGRTYIREWGQNIVVLESHWASKCIQAGRLLLEGDHWGGCLAHDDGLINDEHALPTPRETPSDSVPASLHSAVAPSRTSLGEHSYTDLPNPPSGPHDVPQHPAPPSSQMPYSSSHQVSPVFSQTSGQHLPMAQVQHMQQFMPFVSQSASQNNMMPNFGPTNYNMMTNFGQNNMSSNMAQTNMAQMLPMFMAMASQMGSTSSMDTNFMTALMDSMKHQMNSHPTPLLASPGQLASSSAAQGDNDTRNSPSDRRTTMLRRSEECGARHSDSVSPVPNKMSRAKTKTKGKGKIRDGSGSASDSEADAPIEKPRSVSPSSSSDSPLARSSPENLFKLASKPLRFFVQIDLGNRRNAVVAIKKHGGIIVNHPTDADYAILNSQSKTYNELLARADAADTPALRQAFLFDSISKGRVLATEPYLFDAPIPKKRKARPPETDGNSPKRPKQRATQKASYNASQPTPSTSSQRTPSPTPPPEAGREMHNTSHYRYTDAERNYVLQYAKFLIKRDPLLTNTSLAKKLYDKMPHHSLASWNSHLNSVREELDEIRKRAGIARRKQQSQNENHRSGSALPRPKQELENDSTGQSPLEQDFQRICMFFYEGQADSMSDEEAWKFLTAKYTCQTQPSWPEFYDQHHDKIVDQLKIWYGSQSDADSTQQTDCTTILPLFVLSL